MKVFLSIICLVVMYETYCQNNYPEIIPQPVRVMMKSGNFMLTDKSVISYNHPDLQKIAVRLSQKLSFATGFAFPCVNGQKGEVRLSINTEYNNETGEEGYQLIVSENSVLIRANKAAGIFYGVQTLLQLFPPEFENKFTVKRKWIIPALEIVDYPRFQWRGIMLDVSRHFFTKDEVFKYIEELSAYKFNVLHLHLTDDNGWRIEIKAYPKLTQIGAWRVPLTGRFGERKEPPSDAAATYGGFYTQEDIREIVRFASERYITIVPEIDIPGHCMALLAAYPQLCCTKDSTIKVDPGVKFSEWYGGGMFRMFKDNTLNPSDEQVYVFLENVFTEIAGLFPSEYIHTGGDECYKGYWKQSIDCKELMKSLNTKHVEDLQAYFTGRVEKIIRKLGKKMIGWDEILDGQLSTETVVMSWRGMAGGKEAASLGHKVIMTPNNFAYLDFCQGEPSVEPPVYANLRLSKCYEFNPVPEGTDNTMILGGQGNLWTEQIPVFRHVEYMTFPRAWALAEVFWTSDSLKNWEFFIKRVEKHFQRMDNSGIKYSKAVYDPLITAKYRKDKLYILMRAEIEEIDIFYTTDDTMPDIFTEKYSGEFVLPDGPVTLRVKSYRSGAPIGNLITLSRNELEKRAEKNRN